MPTMTKNQGEQDNLIALRPDRPVVEAGSRELVPVTRLFFVNSLSLIDGVLRMVRVLQAA